VGLEVGGEVVLHPRHLQQRPPLVCVEQPEGRGGEGEGPITHVNNVAGAGMSSAMAELIRLGRALARPLAEYLKVRQSDDNEEQTGGHREFEITGDLPLGPPTL